MSAISVFALQEILIVRKLPLPPAIYLPPSHPFKLTKDS